MADIIKPDENSLVDEPYQPSAGRLPRQVLVRPRQEDFNLPELYEFARRMLWRRRWLILGITLMVAAVTAVQLQTTSPLYQAEARLELGAAPLRILPQAAAAPDQDFISSEAYVETQKELMEGEAVAEGVLASLNLSADDRFLTPPDPGLLIEGVKAAKQAVTGFFRGSAPRPDGGELVDRLIQNRSVRVVPGTRLLEVSYSSPHPELAAGIANSFAGSLIQTNLDNQRVEAEQAKEFLENQLEQLRKDLTESERELNNYARQRNILSIDENQEIVRKRLGDLDQELTKVQSRLMELRAQRNILRNVSSTNFPQSLENDTIRNLKSQLSEREQRLANLSARFGGNWPEVSQLEKEVVQINNQLEQEKRRTLEQAARDYQISEQHYQLSLQRLQAEKRTATQIGEGLGRYQMLSQDLSTKQTLYAQVLQRLKETDMASGLSASHIRVVQTAKPPSEPYWPSKPEFMVLAVVLGLMLSCGLALFLETTDRTLKTQEDMERLIPVICLGVVPRIPEGRAGLGKAPAPVLVDFSSRRPEPEAFRALRTVLLSDFERRPRVILFTSALEGEGKTTSVMNTAFSFAEAGARTCLLDLNVRRPSLAAAFNMGGTKGMGQFLTGDVSLHTLLRETSHSNLFLLPAGEIPANPAELISSRKVDTTFQLLTRFFHFVFVDAPALLSYTDSLVLAPRVDGVVLVVRAASTPAEAVQKAHSNLARVGATVLGTLMNDVNTRSPEHRYDRIAPTASGGLGNGDRRYLRG